MNDYLQPCAAMQAKALQSEWICLAISGFDYGAQNLNLLHDDRHPQALVGFPRQTVPVFAVPGLSEGDGRSLKAPRPRVPGLSFWTEITAAPLRGDAGPGNPQ
jgi:hypothetical protein